MLWPECQPNRLGFLNKLQFLIQRRSKHFILIIRNFGSQCNLNQKMLFQLHLVFVILFECVQCCLYRPRSHHLFALLSPFSNQTKFYFQNFHFSFVCFIFIFVSNYLFWLFIFFCKMLCGFITGRQGGNITTANNFSE